MHDDDWLRPRWPVPDTVGAVMTSRTGGSSIGAFDSMNLGARVGDDPRAVAANRWLLASTLGAQPVFLHQVHGTTVVEHGAGAARAGVIDAGAAAIDPADGIAADTITADAAFTTVPGVACVVQVADCMPVLLASRDARVVGAAHAGWRGAAGGVVERLIAAMCAAASLEPRDLHAWMGPCIGPAHFEVGADVVAAFPDHAACFVAAPRPDGDMRWRADLPAIVRARLTALGVASVSGGDHCTVADRRRFYSYRRDGRTGRHAAAIWIREPRA